MIRFEEDGPWRADDEAWQAANATADVDRINGILAEAAEDAEQTGPPSDNGRDIQLSDPAPPAANEPPADPPNHATADTSPPPPPVNPALIHELNEDPHRLARLLLETKQYEGQLTLRFWRDEFWQWNGQSYTKRPVGEMRAEVTACCKLEADRLCAEALAAWNGQGKMPACFKITRPLTSNVLGSLEALTLLDGEREQPCWLGEASDRPPANEIISTATGLLHVPGLIRNDQPPLPHTPAFFSPNALPYQYDRDARCPRWQRFLSSIWPDDEQSRNELQKWFGYCLLPDTSQHKLVVLLGPPRSGKGVISRTLQRLLGPRNTATPTLTDLAGPFGLQGLVGKTLAMVPDARLSQRHDAMAIVERLLSVAGADPQDVHRKHLPPLTGVRLPVRFMISCNELPALKDAAGAVLSRVLMLAMSQSWVGREDRTLEGSLQRELPGILNWALAGWDRLVEEGGFDQPESGRVALQRFQEMISPVKAFTEERCEVGTAPTFTVPRSDLFHEWLEWAEQNDCCQFAEPAAFGKELLKAWPHIDPRSRITIGGSQIRVYRGIRLKQT